MSVYGDQLSAFAEQFRNVEYFSMETDVVAGFSNKIALGVVRGVFQFMKRSDLTPRGDVLTEVLVPTFWTRKKLVSGNFIKLIRGDDAVYRIVKCSNWVHEGNFSVYELEEVTGNNGEQREHEDVDFGIGDYA